MNHTTLVLLVTVGLFLGMLLLMEIGRRTGIQRIKEDSGSGAPGIGAIDGAVFAVLGLLMAFTFAGATARFDTRRQLIVEETNDIGTAYLRIDLLAADAQPVLRESFSQYLDARIEVYRKLPDIDAAKAFLEKANQLQKQIWRQAVGASRAQGASPAAPMLLLPALNAMFDITTTRTVATLTHPPTIVFVMLFGLALVASLLAGHGMTASRVRSWFHMVGFALVVAAVVYVILDIEYPRLGLIRIDAFDQTLIDLRNSMN
ncbi:MAG TPA: hypothetical protein VLM90_04550 [Candidatus Deferrimicrobium sp.]|nr:hypothetical protein [Candidatus Deferrimicrobium sp.]